MIHTSESDRHEFDLSQKRCECERLDANWDRSKQVSEGPFTLRSRSKMDRSQNDPT